jgi:hypothetical protein
VIQKGVLGVQWPMGCVSRPRPTRVVFASTRHEARDKILFVELLVLPADGMSAAAEKEK